MSIKVNTFEWSELPGEKEVFIPDPWDDGVNAIRIHPWHRGKDDSVYVEVGWYNEDGSEQLGDDGESIKQNVIVNYEDFLEGILAVFPELKRA